MSKDRSLSTAIHILTTMAFHDGALLTSAELAQGCQTNPGLIRRMLSKLSDGGLIECTKGKNGGCKLAKPAKQISLKDVYEAVKDGPLFGSFDKDPLNICVISCNMGKTLTGVYKNLETDLLKSMKKIKIDDVLKSIV